MNLKHLLSLLFLLSLGLSAYSQPAKGHYLPLSFSYVHHTVKDDALSPVSYSGSLGGMGLGYYYQGTKWLIQLDLAGAGGVQKPDVNRDNNFSQTTSALTRANLQVLRQVVSVSNWVIYGGLTSINTFDYRYHNRYGNSRESYESFFSAGIALGTQKSFELFSKKFTFQYTLGLPIGTYYLRPSYVKPNFNGEVGSKDFAFWGDFYLISSKPELIWELENGNQIRLFYHWEFSQLDDLNKVQTNMQQIGISTVLKF